MPFWVSGRGIVLLVSNESKEFIGVATKYIDIRVRLGVAAVDAVGEGNGVNGNQQCSNYRFFFGRYDYRLPSFSISHFLRCQCTRCFHDKLVIVCILL